MYDNHEGPLGELVLPQHTGYNVLPDAVVTAVQKWKEKLTSDILEEQQAALYWLNRIRMEWKV